MPPKSPTRFARSDFPSRHRGLRRARRFFHPTSAAPAATASPSAPAPGSVLRIIAWHTACFSLVIGIGIGFAGYHFHLQLRLLVRPARVPVATALPSAVAPVAPTVPVSAPDAGRVSRSGTPSGRVPLPFACRIQRLAHTPLGLHPFALPESRIVRGVLLPFLSSRRPAAFSLTPDASMMPSHASARSPTTKPPPLRQINTLSCREKLPILAPPPSPCFCWIISTVTSRWPLLSTVGVPWWPRFSSPATDRWRGQWPLIRDSGQSISSCWPSKP